MPASLATPDPPEAMVEPDAPDVVNPLAPTQEQDMVRDMVARYFDDNLKDSARGRGPIEPDHWRQLAALGLLAAISPDSGGAFRGDLRDAVLIAEAFGGALAISPLAEGVVAATGLVGHYGDEAQIDRWVRPVLEGRQHLAWAPGAVVTAAKGSLSGTLPLVRWAGPADALVIPLADAAYLVPTRADGVALEPGSLLDGTPVATVRLDCVEGERIDGPQGSIALFESAAQLCYVAEMVGAMGLLHRHTADYTQQRRQFGSAIGAFQTVQHKLARMFVLLEQARSWLFRASLYDRRDPGFAGAVTAAKAYVGDAAQRLAEEAVQLHGGIGITDDLMVGRGLRRVTVIAQLFGNAGDARAKLLP